LALVQFRLPLVIAGCLLTVAACTTHPKPAPTPSVNALAGLQAQAQRASTRSFTASYEASGGDPARTDTITVYRTPTAARIDVEESGTTVRILSDSSGTYSCRLTTSATPLCVTLAGPGQPLPATLAVQLQLQLLFTSGPAQLAKGTGFEVRPAASQSPRPGVPGSSCYAIVAAPPDAGVSPGTYCFADGLLVTAQFRTGSLQLKSLGSAPTANDFALPASPVPLPSASADSLAASPS
jgi:hypothetical protein